MATNTTSTGTEGGEVELLSDVLTQNCRCYVGSEDEVDSVKLDEEDHADLDEKEDKANTSGEEPREVHVESSIKVLGNVFESEIK